MGEIMGGRMNYGEIGLLGADGRRMRPSLI